MSDVPHAQALAVLAGPKFCDTQLSWAERVNHSGHLLATAALEDDTGAILPGLTHYDIFLSPLLPATVLPFLDGKASSAKWAK